MAFSPGEDTWLLEYAPSSSTSATSSTSAASSTSSTSEGDDTNRRWFPSWGPLWHPQELDNDIRELINKFNRPDWYANFMLRLQNTPNASISYRRDGSVFKMFASWSEFAEHPRGNMLSVEITADGLEKTSPFSPGVVHKPGHPKNRVMYVNFCADAFTFRHLMKDTMYPSFISFVHQNMVQLKRGSSLPDVAQAFYIEYTGFPVSFPSAAAFVNGLYNRSSLRDYTNPYTRLWSNVYSSGTVQEVILHRPKPGTEIIITTGYRHTMPSETK